MAGRATTLLLLALGGILLGSVVTYSRIYSPNPHCGDDRSFLPERGRRASSVGRRYPEAPPPPCARNRHGETEPVGRVTAAHWFVDAAGITWHFVTAGGPGSDGRSSSAAAGAAEASGERPPVVLLHGFPESWWAFHHQIEALAEAGYEAIAIDVIPYGQSDKRLDLDYRSPAIAGAILKLLNRIGVDRFHLVAHDRGSVIGDHLIAQPGAASRVARYVRMQQSASRPHGEPPPHQLMGSAAGTALFRSRRFPALVYRGRLAALPIPGDDVRRLDYEFKYRGIAEAAPLSFRTASFDQELVDRRERLFASMTMPVLFLQGRLDPGQHPEEYFRVEQAVADGTLQFIEAGHFLHLEAPGAVNEAMLAFLDAVAVAPTSETGIDASDTEPSGSPEAGNER